MDIETAIEVLELNPNFYTTPQIYFAYERLKYKNKKLILEAKIMLLRERVLKCKKSGRKFKPKISLDICPVCKGTCETGYEFEFEVVVCDACKNKKVKKECWKCKGKKEIKVPMRIKNALPCKCSECFSNHPKIRKK